MTTTPRGTRFGLEDLNDPNRSFEALVHWDDLEPDLLNALETDPQHGPRLATLRAAERWLHEQAPARPTLLASGPCPRSEELYDFGRGPGHAQLDPARRARIEEHVETCEECQGLVTTLAAPPPLPLDISPLDGTPSDVPARERTVGIPTVHVQPTRQAVAHGLPGHLSAPTPGGRLLRGPWKLVAVAASVLALVGVGLFQAFGGVAARGPAADPLLRGRSAEALVQPRGKLLPPDSSLRELWPALRLGTTFELAPVRDAEAYRIELWSAGADAFTRGAKLGEGESSIPLWNHAEALAPGRYTWEAWVRVNGVESRLGARDFEVVFDAELEARLRDLASSTGLERALELCDRAGYRADARNLARTLPEGALRDLWLAPVPAR